MNRETLNGKIFICPNCNKIHLEFGNFGIDFKTEQNLQEMLKYLLEVKSMKAELADQDNPYRRKIIIPFQHTNIKALLNSEELDELCYLIRSFLNQTTETVTSRVQKNIPLKLLNGISSIQMN